MRWKGRRQSENVEDRRSVSPGLAIGGIGGLGGLVILLLAMFLGVDPQAVLQQMPQQQQQPPPGAAAGANPAGGIAKTSNPAQDELAEFVSVVLADTEDVWTQLFQEMGRAYKVPTLVLFRERVSSACGFQSAATGPFYCPLDSKVYIDLAFYQEMKDRLGVRAISPRLT